VVQVEVADPVDLTALRRQQDRDRLEEDQQRGAAQSAARRHEDAHAHLAPARCEEDQERHARA